jgi:hypothetical protein
LPHDGYAMQEPRRAVKAGGGGSKFSYDCLSDYVIFLNLIKIIKNKIINQKARKDTCIIKIAGFEGNHAQIYRG